MSDSNENVIKSWISTSLVRKVGVGLVAMAVLMLLAIGGVFLQVQQQQTDAVVINVAGRQRTFSQLIANRTQQAINGEAGAIEELQRVTELFDRSLQGLRNGDAELRLPPAPASVHSELDAVAELWDPARQNVQLVLETTSTEGQVRTLARSLGEKSEALIAASQAALTELQEADAPISAISFAQQLPISAERIARLALEIDQGQIGAASRFAEEIQRFNEVLAVLLLGGSSSPAWSELSAVEAAWKPFNVDVQTLLAASEKGLQASRVVVASSEPLLQASDRVVILFEQEAQSKVAWLQQFLTAVTVIFLFVFGVVLWATWRAILPLTDMSRVAARIAEGDLKANVVVSSSRDEIGRLAKAFNTMTVQLREIIDTLEERITERTRQLETVVDVGQRLSGVLDLSDLMRQVVNLTKETFAYYHVHIYLLEGDILIMAEGYGEVGTEMKLQGHSIPLAMPQSLVARAARTGQVITVANVRDDPNWLPNPLLPDTHSEMALPVKLGSEVVGVLDVQSEKVGGLTPEDEVALGALANQIAIAVRNAQRFEETAQALAKAEEIQQRYVQTSWHDFFSSKKATTYQQVQPKAAPIDEGLLTQVKQGAGQGQTVVIASPLENGDGDEAAQSALGTPLIIRGQVIGTLRVHDTENGRHWTSEEIALIESISEQMSLAIENARLFDNTQQRAAREQLAREITDKMRTSPDVEAIIKTGITELTKALGVSRSYVKLNPRLEPKE